MDYWYNWTADDTLTLTIVAVLGVAGLVAMVFFLLNLRDLLRQVREQDQAMKPNLVWLNLIPLFGYVWLIVTVIRVKDSVRAEFKSRGWAPRGDFGFGVGLAFAILNVLSGILTFIPLVVCWIIYWIKTAELKRQMAETRPPAGWATSPGSPSYSASAPPPGSPGTSSAVTQPPRQTCLTCGALSEPGDVFCRSCGGYLGVAPGAYAGETAVTEQKTCPYCGFTNRTDAGFCSSCGRPLP